MQEIMDTEVHECIEAVGSGERHYAVLPSYPNYKVRAHRLGRQVMVAAAVMATGAWLPYYCEWRFPAICWS